MAASEPPKKWRVSCFAYRDDNRNGIYDMADRPYAGLLIELKRPDGSVTSKKSNISGFANFQMSLGYKKAQVFEPGTYTATARPRAGWEPTSDARQQQLTFERRDNAGGRLVLAQNCVPMGVAPVLFIGGRLADDLREQASVSLISDKGTKIDLPLDEAGNYYHVVRPGKWKLQVSGNRSGSVREETIEIKSNPVIVGTITSLTASSTAGGKARTVSFDELTASDTLYEIPFGYHGLRWWNWIATHQKFYRGAGYINGTISSEYMAYNSSGHPAHIWREDDKPFDFLGCHVNVAWPRGEEEAVLTKAWRGGKLVHSDRLRLDTAGSIYFQANYYGITKLEFSHGNYERIVIDDCAFRF